MQTTTTGNNQPEFVPPAQDKRQFGRYTLLYRFASGGMADIYLARLTGTHGFRKLVAIKLIQKHLTDNKGFIEMFVDEARLVSRIAHPNVVQVHELGQVGESHYIGMEYVEGENVAALLRRARPSLSYVARILADAAAGLHAAHELRGRDGQLLNVVHRDVSPGNILISYEGAVKVADFGVARARERLHETLAGTVKGKFAYMAPEVAGQKPVDRRADIFSLGVVLYEMSVRRRLFKAKTPAETLERVLSGPITPPSTIIQGYPEELEEIVFRALKRDPAERYQTAQDVQTALERFLQGTGELVLPANVGQMMSTIFADRIQQKTTLLETYDSEESTITLAVPDVEVATSPSTRLSSLRSFHGRRRWLGIGLAALISLAVFVGTYMLMTVYYGETPARTGAGADAISATKRPAPDGARRETAKAAGGTPDHDQGAKVSIAIKATPERATIFFDGKPVSNPFALQRLAGEGEVEVLVTAPGYLPHKIQVPLAHGGSWKVALRRRRRPITRTRKTTRKVSKKKRSGVGDDVVLDNPYGN